MGCYALIKLQFEDLAVKFTSLENMIIFLTTNLKLFNQALLINVNNFFLNLFFIFLSDTVCKKG